MVDICNENNLRLLREQAEALSVPGKLDIEPYIEPDEEDSDSPEIYGLAVGGTGVADYTDPATIEKAIRAARAGFDAGMRQTCSVIERLRDLEYPGDHFHVTINFVNEDNTGFNEINADLENATGERFRRNIYNLWISECRAFDVNPYTTLVTSIWTRPIED